MGKISYSTISSGPSIHFIKLEARREVHTQKSEYIHHLGGLMARVPSRIGNSSSKQFTRVFEFQCLVIECVRAWLLVWICSLTTTGHGAALNMSLAALSLNFISWRILIAQGWIVYVRARRVHTEYIICEFNFISFL